MEVTSLAFKEGSRKGLANPQLQNALGNIRHGFIAKRQAAREALPEFDALRDSAKAIKDHVLAHLDLYLEHYERKVTEAGGHVHFAKDGKEASEIILRICRSVDAKTIVKGKSMVAEEIGVNKHLKANGLKAIETDLGDYIVQVRDEPPSHIMAPAIHLTREQIEADFRRVHADLPASRDLSESVRLLAEARVVLRREFLAADVGITGANFLIAESGTSVLVTNEGNGDLSQTLPKIHIVVATVEKVVPTFADAAQLLRVLARSATGQDISVYTSFSTGARRPEDPDGPGEYHVVLVDSGRSSLLATEFRDVLRCIRCGACMNHCPVYSAVGGHAYGSTYPGPIGAVLTPALAGMAEAKHLPNASSFCGRCEEVCPVRIPLPKLMRYWRDKEFEQRIAPRSVRTGLRFWSFFARRPALYRLATRVAMRGLRLIGRKGRFRTLPLAGGWTEFRDLPAPEGRTFQSAFARRRV